MTLEKAIELLRFEYSWAEQQNWIMNPLAYALLQVWKAADKEGVKRMTERKRLIKLLNDGCYKACSDASGKKVNEVLADYLLANGVVVVDTNSVKRENLPLIQQAFNMSLDEFAELIAAKQAGKIVELSCKVGDKVYQLDTEGKIYESKITEIIYGTKDIAFGEIAIGRTIFLTKEEAEKALKDCKQ